jgi:hypothetical protein
VRFTEKHIYASEPKSILEVVRLAPRDVSIDVAHAALSLVTEAYQVQFEERIAKPYRLMPGTVQERFQPNKRISYEAHQARMIRHMRGKGSQYYVVHMEQESLLPDAPPEVDTEAFAYAALAKVSPSRPRGLQKAGMVAPNCYLDDVVTHPMLQGQGLASAAVHMALTTGGFDADGPVTLDVYIGNDAVNDWLQSTFGLVPEAEYTVPSLTFSLGQELAGKRYTSSPDASLRSSVHSLEARRPWLRQAIPIIRDL